MNFGGHNRELLVRYLLGQLSDEERDEVGTRLFSDDAFAELLEDAETDLIDRYARGELNAVDANAVRSRLLNSERQQDKLALARASALRGRRAVRSRTRWVLAAAAALVMVVAGSTWWFATKRPTTIVQKVPPPAVSHEAALPAVPAFAALLSPTGTRDAGPQQVTLPQGAGQVRFDLEVLNEDAGPVFSVQLFREGVAILLYDGLRAHVEGSTTLVSVPVASALLTPGGYVFSMSANGGSRVSYRFRIPTKAGP